MAAPPVPDVLVWTLAPEGGVGPAFFPVVAERASFPVFVLKGWIRASGELAGFTSMGWDLYLASDSGQRLGAAPLPPGHAFSSADGPVVNVWVEPKPGVVAGEPLGPDSWAGGVLGAGLAWTGSSHVQLPPPPTPLYLSISPSACAWCRCRCS